MSFFYSSELFLSFYGLSHHSALWDAIGVFLAEYLAYVWAAVLVIVVVWPHRHQARNRVAIAMSIVAALIARFGVKAAIMLAYPQPRPFVSLPNIHPLIAVSSAENFQSFPSGHAIFFFALATVLFCFNRKVGLLAFAAAAAIGMARVYVGVHWPNDILAGAVLGILTGWLVYRFYAHHEKYIDAQVARVFKILRLW